MLDRRSLCAPRHWIGATAFLMLLATGSISRAATVQAGIWPGTNLQSVDIVLDGTGRTVSAGTLSVSLDGGPIQQAYCVDLFNVFGIGDSWAVNIKPIADLMGSGGNPPPIGNGGGVGWLYETYAGSVASDTDRAGLQVAIWEMVYDGPSALDLDMGYFQMSSPLAIKNAALGFLASYQPNDVGAALWIEAVSHPNGRNQDFVTAVPEPATLAMLIPLALAAGAKGLMWRRRVA